MTLLCAFPRRARPARIIINANEHLEYRTNCMGYFFFFFFYNLLNGQVREYFFISFFFFFFKVA